MLKKVQIQLKEELEFHPKNNGESLKNFNQKSSQVIFMFYEDYFV